MSATFGPFLRAGGVKVTVIEDVVVGSGGVLPVSVGPGGGRPGNPDGSATGRRPVRPGESRGRRSSGCAGFGRFPEALRQCDVFNARFVFAALSALVTRLADRENPL
ncbi:hypothetical protein JCM9957A_35560 [Kineosporia succinea]